MSEIYRLVSRGYVRGQLDDINVVGATTIGDAPEIGTAKPEVKELRMRDEDYSQTDSIE